MFHKDTEPAPIPDGSRDHGVTEPGVAMTESLHHSQDTLMVRRQLSILVRI